MLSLPINKHMLRVRLQLRASKLPLFNSEWGLWNSAWRLGLRMQTGCGVRELCFRSSTLLLPPTLRKKANWLFFFFFSLLNLKGGIFRTLNSAFCFYLSSTHILTWPLNIPLETFEVLSWNPSWGEVGLETQRRLLHTLSHHSVFSKEQLDKQVDSSVWIN